MRKENFDWQRMNLDEMPGDIPLPDEGWNEMRQRLDEEMPGTGLVIPIKAQGVSFFKNRLLISIAALLLLLFSIWLFSGQSELTKDVDGSDRKVVGHHSSSNESKDAQAGSDEENSGDLNNAENLNKENNDESKKVALSKNVANEPDNDPYSGQTASKQEALKTILKPGLPRLKKVQNSLKGALTYVKNKNPTKQHGNRKTGWHVEEKLIKAAGDITDGNGNKMNQADTARVSGVTSTRDETINHLALRKAAESFITAQENAGIGESDKIIVTGGTQWNLQAPALHAVNYFGGPAGKREPYRIVIPGIWVDVQLETNLLSLEINPFYSQQLPGKSIVTSTKTQTRGDTTIFINEAKTVNRVFGTGINIGYAKNIIRSWWAGGGLEANWWRNAAIRSNVTEERMLSGNSSVIATNSFAQSNKIEAGDWKRVSKFQVKVTGEIFYRKKQLAAGLRLGFPMLPFTDSKGPQHPLDTRLVVQWPLLRHSTERRQ